MKHRISFENSSEIGAYTLLTNKYCLVGRSKSRNFYSHFESALDIPIAETTLNAISTVGNMATGNSHGLLLPGTASDQEVQHIRNLIPDSIKIRRVNERLNALGNVIICNDTVALVHPEVTDENIEIIQDTLAVEVFRQNIGNEPLVGTFAAMNGFTK